jgi:3-methyladenine DNA glycosylase AlkC
MSFQNQKRLNLGLVCQWTTELDIKISRLPARCLNPRIPPSLQLFASPHGPHPQVVHIDSFRLVRT